MDGCFADARDLVMTFLEVGEYSASVVSAHLACLKEVEGWLAERGLPLGRESIERWISERCGSWAGWRLKAYRNAASHLADACEGNLLPRCREPHELSSYYALLPEWARDEVDSLMHEDGSIDRSNAASCRSDASRFLLFASERGIGSLEEATPTVAALYIAEVSGEGAGSIYHLLARAREVLRAAAGATPAVDDARELLSARYARRLRLVEPEGIGELDALPADLDERAYMKLARELVGTVLPGAGYSGTQVNVARMALHLFFCYMALGGHAYTHRLAVAWVEANREGIGSQWKGYRRAHDLYERYRRDGAGMSFQCAARKPDLVGSAPEWARGALSAYIALREREGLAESSIATHKSACVRLCAYAAASGAESFADVTPQMVLGFSLDDPHSTPGSRACYVGKARAFLGWLAEEGMAQPGLSRAALAEAAPSTGVVSVLSDEMVGRIMEARAAASTPRELRDAAMVMLGLRMGLRSVDVVGLRLRDISWRRSTVAIVQRKTHAQLELPLMADTGNSVAAWVLRGRPECDSPYVFVRLNAPHTELSPCACRKALRAVLGDLAGDCTGFHELRRTFATAMLRGGASGARISEALGHRTESSTGPYLSLDGDRMRLCAMSPSSAAVPAFEPRGRCE